MCSTRRRTGRSSGCPTRAASGRSTSSCRRLARPRSATARDCFVTLRPGRSRRAPRGSISACPASAPPGAPRSPQVLEDCRPQRALRSAPRRLQRDAHTPLRLILDVIHEAVIEVDETGTVAAAATPVTMVVASSLPPEPVVMHVDRPFFFVLHHGRCDTPFFVGRVWSPSTRASGAAPEGARP